MKNVTLSVFALFISVALSASEYDPVASPAAIVVEGQARFTVLTPGLIRLEWAADGRFTDAASLTFVNRKLPVPEFTREVRGDTLILKTELLTLEYRRSAEPFSAANLGISFLRDGQPVHWAPGQANTGNLGGTTRTLDNTDGAFFYRKKTNERTPIKLEDGILSRDGWTLVDDSQRPLFDTSDWPWAVARPAGARQDLYFFAYGTDYKKALADFTLIGGHIALPPKFVFGTWWSRYWEYNDSELRQLVGEFETFQVPLDVLVIDMDWHLVNQPEWFNADGTLKTDQAGQRIGWTGFTWNKLFFPDPDRLLRWTNEKGLMTCLNIHPASGVQPHEEQYPAMARAMGLDPSSGTYVPFDITDKKFAGNYLGILLHPLEKMGIDFWWLDWQQWGNTKIEGINPTFYLNYVHYSDMARQDKGRPLIFHRWGGLGNHRYQIGFSGDVNITWDSLAYQPYFTMTAANVGFGYWSHDIGGHMGGIRDAELYTRWVQWGAYSPVLRTHATKDPTIERRIWAYPLENFAAMRQAYVDRYALIPYIYTQARKAYDTGVSLCHPLYYDYPREENAYACQSQYMFGDSLLVSPVTEPMGGGQLFVKQKLWLPAGQWYELATGTLLDGNRTLERPVTLDEIPVYARAGAIIPRQSSLARVDQQKLDSLILSVYPGESGSTELYEDEGNNNHFKQGASAITAIRFAREGRRLTLTIDPARGSFPGMVQQRRYEVRFPCSFPARTVRVNGRELPYSDSGAGDSWTYDGNELATRVLLEPADVRSAVRLEVEFVSDDLRMLSGKKGRFRDLLRAYTLCRNAWLERSQFNFQRMARLAQTGQELTYSPQTIMEELAAFEAGYPTVLQLVRKAAVLKPECQSALDLLEARQPHLLPAP